MSQCAIVGVQQDAPGSVVFEICPHQEQEKCRCATHQVQTGTREVKDKTAEGETIVRSVPIMGRQRAEDHPTFTFGTQVPDDFPYAGWQKKMRLSEAERQARFLRNCADEALRLAEDAPRRQEPAAPPAELPAGLAALVGRTLPQ